MDPIVLTPRVKLTLVTKAERGSQEFEWLHQMRSDEQATFWSIMRRSETIEDTERNIKNWLPLDGGQEKTYRVAYAVHRFLEPETDSAGGEPKLADQTERPTEFVGVVSLKSLDPGALALPEELTIPATTATTTLMIEVAYMFLPKAWGKGLAPESVSAMFEACKRAPSFWAPFSKLYVRSMVNEANSRSLRVMEKTGMEKKGVFHWIGKPGEKFFVAGAWREEDRLCIFGKYLLE